MRRQLLAATLTALLALGATACQVEEFEGDPLQDDPMDEGLENPTTTGDNTLYGDS